jgi:predicted cobalt transporter CbtA
MMSAPSPSPVRAMKSTSLVVGGAVFTVVGAILLLRGIVEMTRGEQWMSALFWPSVVFQIGLVMMYIGSRR